MSQLSALVQSQSSEFKVQSSEFKVQSSKFRVQSSEFRVQKKKADPKGLPLIGDEILFTADFVDIHCIRLLRCETTFCAKMV